MILLLLSLALVGSPSLGLFASGQWFPPISWFNGLEGGSVLVGARLFVCTFTARQVGSSRSRSK